MTGIPSKGTSPDPANPARQPRRWLMAAVVLVLVTVACGGPGAPADTGQAPGGEARPEVSRVSVGVTSLHTWYWWIMAAQGEGLMEPYGIELDVVEVANTAQLANGLVGGSIHFAHVAPESIFTLQQQAPDVKIVGSVLNVNPYTMVARPELSGPTDLRGGVLGVTTIGSSADFFTCKLLLRNHGLELGSDYDAVNTGPTAQRAAAMLSGEIDAACNFEPELLELVNQGMTELESAADAEHFRAVEVINLNATERWYTENRDVAVRFMQGFRDSLDWLADESNRDRAIELLAAEMQVDPERAAATYERFIVELDAFSKDGLIDPKRLENTVRNAQEADVEFVPAMDDLNWRYDNSLVEEAAAASG